MLTRDLLAFKPVFVSFEIQTIRQHNPLKEYLLQAIQWKCRFQRARLIRSQLRELNPFSSFYKNRYQFSHVASLIVHKSILIFKTIQELGIIFMSIKNKFQHIRE